MLDTERDKSSDRTEMRKHMAHSETSHSESSQQHRKNMNITFRNNHATNIANTLAVDVGQIRKQTESKQANVSSLAPINPATRWKQIQRYRLAERQREHQRKVARASMQDLRQKRRKQTWQQLQRSQDRREYIWRAISQYHTLDSSTTNSGLYEEAISLYKDYEEDRSTFVNATRGQQFEQECAVCGISFKTALRHIRVNDELFLPLYCKSQLSHIDEKRTKGAPAPRKWTGYYTDRDTTVCVCNLCWQALIRKRIPKFSRKNIPLQMPCPPLSELTEFEQLLISPVLPMVYIYRFQGYGQYQSKGQCVAFQHCGQRIASELPRTPSDIIINIADVYGKGIIQIRAYLIKCALEKLKRLGHPAFKEISISNDRIEHLNEISKKLEHSDTVRKDDSHWNPNATAHGTDGKSNSHDTAPGRSSEHAPADPKVLSASEALRGAGQQQEVEETFAIHTQNMPLAVEVHGEKALEEAVLELFREISSGSAKLYSSNSSSDGWPDRFPCLMPDGRGGPKGVFVHINLREWIAHVLRIRRLNFHTHITFICYANIITRRNKITGLIAKKPISQKVPKAVEELVRLSHERTRTSVPESTLQVLMKQVSVFVDKLPGSVRDMADFRKDLITMMVRKGPPSFFLTLSAADSVRIETYLDILKGASIQDVKNLSSQQRLELLSSNPVLATMSFKNRLDSILKFILEGKSQPLGKISHYAIKAEWQGRLSEHAHILLWTAKPLPPVQNNDDDKRAFFEDEDNNETDANTTYTNNDDNDNKNGNNEIMVKRAEAVASAYLPVVDNAAITEDNLKLRASHPRKANIVDAIRNEPIPLGAHINESNK